jgi:glycerol-3-phosphate dehydrogenase
MNRTHYLAQISDKPFDVCIIGGGATGAGCALDAALRGLSVILIEKDDFGAHTSSKSTKLIHGGVRYLEQAFKKLDMEQYRMVKKALAERSTLLHLAPHLTRPLALLTPCYSWFDRLYYGIGLKLYDHLASKNILAKSLFLNKKDTLSKLPFLQPKNLTGSILYYDGQLDDARYNLALIRTAAQYGAVTLNHVRAIAFQNNTQEKINTLTIEDTFTSTQYTIQARCFVNATGTFADQIRQKANANLAPRMRVSKGAHLVAKASAIAHTPDAENVGMLVPKTDDGRVLFMLPWQNHWLVGTTDTEDTLQDAPQIDQEDAQYMMNYVERYFTSVSKEHFIRAGWAGQRPLLQANPDADTKQLVRDHEVELDEKSGLISIMGGKWTTYRLMAKDTIDVVMSQLGLPIIICRTETTRLDGAEGFSDMLASSLVQSFGLDAQVAAHLVQKYGANASKIVSNSSHESLEPFTPSLPYTPAELRYNLQEEMACSLEDVLERRWGIGLMDWQDSLELVLYIAPIMAQYLGWTSQEMAENVQDYQSSLASLQSQMNALN